MIKVREHDKQCHESYAPTNEQIPTQDKIDAERYRWLASRICNGSLGIYQITAGAEKPWSTLDFEKLIDQSLKVEQTLLLWQQKTNEASW